MHVYPEPDGQPIPLLSRPLLESWNAKDHPDQVHLEESLDQLEKAAIGRWPNGSIAIDLAVGFPLEWSLTSRGHDLDNYLFPVARRFKDHDIVSAWAAKRCRGASAITIVPVGEPIGAPVGDWLHRSVLTKGSTALAPWKREVRAQVAGEHRVTGEGGIERQVSFSVHRRRNWTNLWKPAIDSLGAILGVADPNKPFHPRDDRIVRLGLHRFESGGELRPVALDIWWRPSAVDERAAD